MTMLKKTLMLFACLLLANANEDAEVTKLKSAKRMGLAKLTFMCRFSTGSRRNVAWLLNGKSVEGYHHFKIVNKYKQNKQVLTTTLKVIDPSITQMKDNYTCISGGASHSFTNIEGISHIYGGWGEKFGDYIFARQGHSLKFNPEKVKKICREWGLEYGGKNQKNRACQKMGCKCKKIPIFKAVDVTRKMKIKPVPFISIQLHDFLNLPKDYRFDMSLVTLSSSEPAVWFDFKNVTDLNVTFSHDDFKPNHDYQLHVEYKHPFQKKPLRNGNDMLFTKNVLSSSLKPGTPRIVTAENTSDGKCRVEIELPENVDVEDTYEHFIPEILVHREVSENVSRVSDLVFEVEAGGEVSARILSTERKYNSDLSEAVECV